MQVLQLTTLFEVRLVVCAFCSVRQSDEMFKAAGVSQFGHALNSSGAFVGIMVCHGVLSWELFILCPYYHKKMLLACYPFSMFLAETRF